MQAVRSGRIRREEYQLNGWGGVHLSTCRGGKHLKRTGGRGELMIGGGQSLETSAYRNVDEKIFRWGRRVGSDGESGDARRGGEAAVDGKDESAGKFWEKVCALKKFDAKGR